MTKLKLTLARKILLVCLLTAIVFLGGYWVGAAGFQAKVDRAKKIKVVREIPADQAGVDFSLFWKVWDTLESQYFDKTKIKTREMVYGAIAGMVSALRDPYTVFLSPGENKIVQEDLSGSFEGIGIQIGFKGSQLAVIAPLADSPAEKVGIKAGDFIVGIKDESKGIDQGTVGLSLPEAVKLIRGKAGSKITLLLTRQGEAKPFSIEVVRAKMEVPSVTTVYPENSKGVVQLKVLKFNGDTLAEWNASVQKILQKGQISGLVLDLRNNPGGYLEGSIDLAAEFLPEGSLVVIEERAGGLRKEYRTDRIGKLREIPLVVLINEGSASAAEILAGALRDIKKAKLVGETTFGKGSIQEPLQFEGNTGLHITVARWLTPSGFWVNEKGLEPDVKIKDDEETPEDEQLQEALKLLEN